VSLTLFNFHDRQAHYLAVSSASPEQTPTGSTISFDAFGLPAIQAMEHGERYSIADTLAIDGMADMDHQHLLQTGIRSWLHQPLLYQGQLIGSLNFGSAQPGVFTLEQTDLARQVADQLAVAIRHSQLREETQRRVEVLAALHQIGLDLNAQLDLPTLLRTIMERAARLLNAPMGGLYLLQPDGVTLQPVANLPTDDISSPVRIGEGLVGQVAQSGQPLVIPDYLDWSGRLVSIANPPFRAVVGVPIQWQQQALGVVSVCDSRPGRFGFEDAEIVSLFAAQAAVAIQNARLFNATQRQVEELKILRSVAVAASEAMSEDDLIEQATQMMGQALFQDYCGVLLIDFEHSILRVHPSHQGMVAEMKQATIPLGQGVTGRVAASGEAWRLGDVSLESSYLAANPKMRSELCVPLKSGDRVIGVLNVESPLLNAFNDLDERLLTTIAGQLAPAIERLRAEAQIRHLNAELEQRVAERTAQLKAANHELESFSYSVSHDLRAPLRSIDGFSQALLEDYRDQMHPEGVRYIDIIRSECQHMGQLIDDLINLARVTRIEIHSELVNLSHIAETLIAVLRQRDPERQVEVMIAPDLHAYGDHNLLQIMLDNLLSNAWKFTSKQPKAYIEVGVENQPNHVSAFFVRDNGAGFDMTYANKLFGAFQRLHHQTEFAGTGIGLATVQRILQRHGGQAWAMGAIQQGATFYFVIPNETTQHEK